MRIRKREQGNLSTFRVDFTLYTMKRWGDATVCGREDARGEEIMEVRKLWGVNPVQN